MNQRCLKSLKLTRSSIAITRKTFLITKLRPEGEGDWFKGKMTWYNTKMEKLKIYDEEYDSGDYITEEELNRVDLIMQA